MAQPSIQTAFHSGEWAPSLNARVDLAKYHSAAALLRNFFVDYRGGASTRPGTEYILQCFDSTHPVRLITFAESFVDTYILEFGQFYIRFFRNSGPILESPVAITNITQAAIATITAPGHTYVAGDWVFVIGVLGMTQVNDRYFIVTGISGADFTIANLDGTNVNSTGYTAYISGGTTARILKITSPYAAADLHLLKFAQNVGTMIFTHPNYAPYLLTFIAADNWLLAPASFAPTILAPTALMIATTLSSGPVAYAYAVTSVDGNGQESGAAIITLGAKQDITTTPGTNSISWTAATNAESYNVYRAELSYAGAVPAGASFGFLGNTFGTGFIDTDIIPDFAASPPIIQNPFTGGVNPSVPAYFQQRLVLAAPTVAPQTFYMSQPGSYFNFNISIPTAPDDAITGSIVSDQLNAIKSMISMPSGLITLTSRAAWLINGGTGGQPITPSTASAQTQAYNGASDLPPIVSNYDILYVQAKGSIVRDLSFNLYANVWTGADISVLSSHLFYGYSMLEWAYAEEPFKLVQVVRNDGDLLSLTFLKEQELIGWTHYDTKGLFKSIATATEATIDAGNVDAVYVVVERGVSNQTFTTFQYIERFAERIFPYGVEDAFCVDSGLKSTGAFPAANLVFEAATGLNKRVNADVAVFNSGMIGWVIRAGGGIATIQNFDNNQQVRVDITQAITDVVQDDPANPVAIQLAGSWTLWEPHTTFSGLDHLNGQAVTGLADGQIVPPTIVVDGAVTLSAPATKVILGLAFTCQLQTLRLDLGEPTIQGKRKKITAVTVRVDNTLGLSIGMTTANLVPMKDLAGTTLITGDARTIVDPLWDIPGQYYLQQTQPLPATVLGVIPETIIGDTK